ncbi:MAG: hypothetical protein IJS93_02040 [Clostridia bacterium]|nr:hypothetical protein [Clostridia bacterium]
MKKGLLITIIALLSLALLLLAGCGEATYTVRIESGGARIYSYTVRLDASDLDVEKQRAAVRTVFTYYADRIDRATFTDTDPNVLTLEIRYDDLTDYYIANGITGNEPNEPSEWEKEGVLFQKYYTVLFVADKGNFEYYALQYLDAYDATFRQNYVVKAYAAANNGSLSAVYSQVVRNAVANEDAFSTLRALVNDGNSSYAEEAQTTAYEWMKELGYDYSKVTAYFRYSMYFRNVKGQNPDEVYTEDGQTVYKWKLDPFSANEFTLTQTVPSVWVWELLSIAAGLMVAGVCIALIIVKKKIKGEKKGEPTGENEEDKIDGESGESDDADRATTEEPNNYVVITNDASSFEKERENVNENNDDNDYNGNNDDNDNNEYNDKEND